MKEEMEGLVYVEGKGVRGKNQKDDQIAKEGAFKLNSDSQIAKDAESVAKYMKEYFVLSKADLETIKAPEIGIVHSFGDRAEIENIERKIIQEERKNNVLQDALRQIEVPQLGAHNYQEELQNYTDATNRVKTSYALSSLPPSPVALPPFEVSNKKAQPLVSAKNVLDHLHAVATTKSLSPEEVFNKSLPEEKTEKLTEIKTRQPGLFDFKASKAQRDKFTDKKPTIIDSFTSKPKAFFKAADGTVKEGLVVSGLGKMTPVSGKIGTKYAPVPGSSSASSSTTNNNTNIHIPAPEHQPVAARPRANEPYSPFRKYTPAPTTEHLQLKGGLEADQDYFCQQLNLLANGEKGLFFRTNYSNLAEFAQAITSAESRVKEHGSINRVDLYLASNARIFRERVIKEGPRPGIDAKVFDNPMFSEMYQEHQFYKNVVSLAPVEGEVARFMPHIEEHQTRSE
jgi:hypothetical protein